MTSFDIYTVKESDSNYSHSIVAGGFVVTSYTTLLMLFTSFTILAAAVSRTS